MAIDIVLGGAGIIIGVLLLIGKSDFLMSNMNQPNRDKLYDNNKLNRALGIGLILLGVGTLVSAFVNVQSFAIAYMVYIIVVMAGVAAYIILKCRK